MVEKCFFFINCRICLDELILLCLCPLVESLKKMGNFEVSLSKKVCIIIGINHCKKHVFEILTDSFYLTKWWTSFLPLTQYGTSMLEIKKIVVAVFEKNFNERMRLFL